MPVPASTHLGLDLQPGPPVTTVIACGYKHWEPGKLLWHPDWERTNCGRCKKTLEYKDRKQLSKAGG